MARDSNDSFDEIDITHGAKRNDSSYVTRSETMHKGTVTPEGWPLKLDTGPAASDLVFREHSRPVFQKSTIIPFLSALALTLLPTVGLLIYILVTREATISDCSAAIEVPRCTISQRTVILDDPVQRFLTVTKVVDSVQQLATVWTLSLAAFLIADTWLRSPENPLTAKTLALVVNMYASGRWWTLYDSALSMYHRTARISRPFVQAIAILLTTLLISRLVTGVDFWLHFVSRESVFMIGEASVVPTGQLSNFMFSRTPNTTCYNDEGVSRIIGAPCTLNPNALGGNPLAWPAQASSLAVNQSTVDSISLLFSRDGPNGTQSNMAIVTPTGDSVVNASLYNYNASTIGISATCESITQACNLRQVAHGTGGYNCSSLGEPEFSATLASGSLPGLINNYVPERFSNMTTNASDPVMQYYLLGMLSGNGSDFSTGGGNPTTLTLARCSIQSYRVSYMHTAGIQAGEPPQLTLLSKELLNKNETDTYIGPFLSTTAYMEDALSASKGAAQISGAAFIRTLGQEVARYALAYDAMAWESSPATSVSLNPTLRTYSLVPLVPLTLFFVFVFLYAVFIVVLFVLTTRTGRASVAVPRGGAAMGRDGATLTDLAQRRLVRTDFLLHQLLSTDEGKATVTDADNVFRGEEDTPVVLGTHATSGVLGIYVSDHPTTSPLDRGESQAVLARRSASIGTAYVYRRHTTAGKHG